MPLLVVGSVAIDTVETPFGVAEGSLGGSAAYFSLAASHFSPVRLVSVVGEDFPRDYHEALACRDIGLEGLTVSPGRTFRWHARYEGPMDQAETREVQLNVLEDFLPQVPPCYCDSRFVFLANSSPRTQLHVRRQLTEARFVVADTMNFYIEKERHELLELLRVVDALILNDAEARQLSGSASLLHAARWVCERGPRYCIIKKGEHGAMLVGEDGAFVLPAYLAENVLDPTGAGDSFAGGLMGYVAACAELNEQVLRRALAYGMVVASFAIEQFGPTRLMEISRPAIEERLERYVAMTHIR